MPHNNVVIFNAADLRPVIQEALDNRCQLLLVKDQGLYFMSEEGPINPQTKRRLVAYADGLNPDTAEFDDWYDRLRGICGGDDFAETISPQDTVIQAVLRYHTRLHVSFTKTTFRMVSVPQ
jgi:hypothetical protein